MAEGQPQEAAKVKFAKKEYDMDTGVLEIAFGNGESFEADSNTLSEEMRKNLMLHGLSQKLGDSYAGVKGNFVEALTNVKAVFEGLKNGDWSTAGDEARPRLAELAEAIARIKSVPIEKATAAVEKATDEQRKAWRGNAEVKAAIAAARAEKAAKALAAAPKQELQVDLS